MKISERKLLLVEDNPDDEFLTLDAFRRNNIPNLLHVVRDGAEALDYLFCAGVYAGRDPSDEPAVILLDLNLPKIGGLDVLRRMRADERTKRIPVVVLTTSEEQKDLITSYNLGCNSYICKPVEMDKFVEAVRQLGIYWLEVNRLPTKRIE